ncbi:SIR2 family protein [Sulfurimonas sp.]|uniref:SIR2 family protein n=1 Tax=Sulfurimonas sp. TaxID=2022749 RepID=UPI002624E27D|nr:SIR2 family protein [Sulfurimonas sp.]MDD3855238.1 SIR2 family protein [Sulfurimonas sp.]
MNKNLYLILGNGFTIDFINHIGNDEIDASNFFKYGAEIPWPGTGEPGFLSSKNCPNLWNLGARPNMNSKKAIDLIEDIITCINVYASHPKKSLLADNKQNDIYFYAYLELVEYIRNLFVFYDKKINNISDKFESWSWLKFLRNAYEQYDKIYIVTYNYDVWLEKILQKAGLDFSIYGFDAVEEKKIVIFKPHGSISFQHKTSVEKDAYIIKKSKEIDDDKLENFNLLYTYENISSINAIIPPASEAGRMQGDGSWSKEIHNEILNIFNNTNENDECIMCGISYWHVDRNEIDNILVRLSPKINIKMINPYPPKSLTAVLTSLFKNFVLYPKSNILERLIK